ncbi:ribonuclease II [Gemmatimonadetes bacterium T265]|nr:ribonuclease II [Gemmatimonadetes bacterium T265]
MAPPAPAFDLRAAARAAALGAGFVPDLDDAARAELAAIEAGRPNPGGAPPGGGLPVRDLRALPWSSIDDASSRDLDQVEVAESLPDGTVRVRVGIADVDALVPRDSALDRHAAVNTTSVYTGLVTFSMLPEALSTDRTSLNADADRATVVIDFVVAADGTVSEGDVYLARTVNHARLAYEELGAWFDGRGPLPAAAARAPAVLGMEAQLRLQEDTAERLRRQRVSRGALQLETIEARPVVQGGAVTGLTVTPKSKARDLIEDFMVAANAVVAETLEAAGVTSIRRVVRIPERWDRIAALARARGDALPDAADPAALSAFLGRQRAAHPEQYAELSLAVVKLLGPGEYAVEQPGDTTMNHFGLAAQDYTHGTAPNRRYADLVTQRLVKYMLARRAGGEPALPYSDDALTAIAAHCTERENAARKVERLTRKQAGAALLAGRVGETFRAVVTGAQQNGTYVRLAAPPVEGRVVHGAAGLDVGDAVPVKLVSVDPAHGWVDFARAS